MIKTIRQGDLLFIPQQETPQHVLDFAVAGKRKNGVIAEGEATGHHHRVATLEDATVFQAYNDVYVRVGPNGVSIVHERFKTEHPEEARFGVNLSIIRPMRVSVACRYM